MPIVATAVLLASGACRYHEVPTKPVASQTFDFQLGDGQPERVHLQFHAGRVRVRHGDRVSCRASVDVSVRDQLECEELLENLRPRILWEGETLALGIDQAPETPLGALYVFYHLTVPPTTDLRIVTDEGFVEIKDFQAELTAQTVVGGIDATLAGGTADLRTQSGSIELDGDYRHALLESDDGRLDASWPNGPGDASLDVRTTSGRVVLKVPRGRRVDVSLDGKASAVSGPVHWLDGESGRVGPDSGPPDGRLHLSERNGTVQIETSAP